MGRRRRFIGCIADKSTIVDKKSWEGLPETRAQELELTRDDIEEISSQMEGLTMKINHSKRDVECGNVNRAWYDEEEKKWMVDFSIADDSTYIGGNTGSLIDHGIMPGLSAAHELFTNKPREVSLCWLPARPWCYIEREILDDDQDTGSIAYNKRNQQPVIDVSNQIKLNESEVAISLDNADSVVHAMATFVRQPEVKFATKKHVVNAAAGDPFVFLSPTVTIFPADKSLLLSKMSTAAAAANKPKWLKKKPKPAVGNKTVLASAANGDDDDHAEDGKEEKIIEASENKKKNNNNKQKTTEASTHVRMKPKMSMGDRRNMRMAADPNGTMEEQLDRSLPPQGRDPIFGTPPGAHGEEDDQYEFGAAEPVDESAENAPDDHSDDLSDEAHETAHPEPNPKNTKKALAALNAMKQKLKQKEPANSKRKRKSIHDDHEGPGDNDGTYSVAAAAFGAGSNNQKKKSKVNPALSVLKLLPEDQQLEYLESLEKAKRTEKENAKLKKAQKKFEDEQAEKNKAEKAEIGDALAKLVSDFTGAKMSPEERETLRSGDLSAVREGVISAATGASKLLSRLRRQESNLKKEQKVVRQQRLDILKQKVLGDDGGDDESGGEDEDIEPGQPKPKKTQRVVEEEEEQDDEAIESDNDNNNNRRRPPAPAPKKHKNERAEDDRHRSSMPPPSARRERSTGPGDFMDDETTDYMVRASAGILPGVPRNATRRDLRIAGIEDNTWLRGHARSVDAVRKMVDRDGRPFVTEAAMKILMGDTTDDDGEIYKPKGLKPYRDGDYRPTVHNKSGTANIRRRSSD